MYDSGSIDTFDSGPIDVQLQCRVRLVVKIIKYITY